jgi:Kef-type K+ transport system membrane component KefB/nucleotide-binding universal stress UspA family protein
VAVSFCDRWAARSLLAIAILFLLSADGFASDEKAAGPSEVIFLIQILVLILVGRVLGELMQRMGQPAVTGQLIAGILLGHSVFGVLWPDAQRWMFPSSHDQKAMLDAISQLGILMLLLLTGMETDLRLVRKVGRAAITVSGAGIIIPFICGFVLGEFLPDSMLPRPELRIVTSLFLGTALSIASIKIVAMVIREMNFMRRNLGQIIVSSAIIDDSVGWIIISIIFSLAEHGAVDLASLTRSVFGTAVFLGISFTFGPRIVFFLIRWTNDNFVSDLPVISVILLIMGGMALITHFIGVHTVLGAFVAGVLIGESPILTKHIDEQLRGLITALFAPVFFGAAGLSTDLTILKDPQILLLTLGLIAIASIGKFGGAFAGGKLGGLNRRESLAVALGMNARGSTEVIIATIGLSLGALSQNLFTMIVTMAVITTMIMPPTLRWALQRIPIRKEEEQRLEREAFTERGFVTNLERLLLAVDESPSGKLASRLAGLIAGSHGTPVTMLKLSELTMTRNASNATKTTTLANAKEDSARTKTPKDAEATLKAAAEKPKEHQTLEKKKENIEVITRVETRPSQEAVAKEARKGYDLLFVGIKSSKPDKGGLPNELAQIAAEFDGPLAVAEARGKHLEHSVEKRLKILVPITGTDVSRRGAEVAIALARAENGRVTALYVSTKSRPRSLSGRLQRSIASHRVEEAILKDITHMADQYESNMKTAVRTNIAAADAILREAREGSYDLIVMGVNRRPGDTPFFGDVATAVLAKSECSILFMSNELRR